MSRPSTCLLPPAAPAPEPHPREVGRQDLSHLLSPLLLIGIVASLGGCMIPISRAIEAPAVALGGVDLERPGTTTQALRVDIRMINPNPTPVSVGALTYDLDVAGADFADGRTDESFVLPAEGEILVPFEADVPANDLLALEAEAGPDLQVDYVLKGVAELDGIGLPDLPFQGVGRIALPNVGATPPVS